MTAFQKKAKSILTAYEVSQFLKIPLSTLYVLSKAGKIKGIKVGKHWRYLAQDILSYFSQTEKNHRNSYSTDQRFYPRLNCELNAEAKILLTRKSSQATQSGWIYNLSEGGLLFSSGSEGAQVETGDPVQIIFHMSEDHSSEKQICVAGRVIHCTGGKKHRFGIKFKSLSEANKEAIRHYVG